MALQKSTQDKLNHSSITNMLARQTKIIFSIQHLTVDAFLACLLLYNQFLKIPHPTKIKDLCFDDEMPYNEFFLEIKIYIGQ